MFQEKSPSLRHFRVVVVVGVDGAAAAHDSDYDGDDDVEGEGLRPTRTVSRENSQV